MFHLEAVIKPWYIYRPTQILRRAIAQFSNPQGFQEVRTAWGATMIVDTGKAIGKGILHTGVHELAVSEVGARLIEAGDTVVDVGANVGYMTLLFGLRAGKTGRIISFEPHRDLYPVLQENVANASVRYAFPRAEVHDVALGSHDGWTEMLMPSSFGANDGTARMGAVGERQPSGPGAVRVSMLDGVIEAEVSLMKLDVEGAEWEVLKGARNLLQRRAIKHVLFEEHHMTESNVGPMLATLGYSIFSLGWSLGGPLLGTIRDKLARPYETPNYLATLDPAEAVRRCSSKGWLVLQPATAHLPYEQP